MIDFSVYDKLVPKKKEVDLSSFDNAVKKKPSSKQDGGTLPTVTLSESDLETPSGSQNNFTEDFINPLSEINRKRAANSVTTKSEVLGKVELKDEDIPANIMDKAGYRKSLQLRLDTNTPDEIDLQVISNTTKKPVAAVKEYAAGKDGKGVMVEFDTIKTKKETVLKNLIEIANGDLGLSDTFESVFTSPETAKAYLDKIEKSLAQKTERQFEALNTVEVDGKKITYDEESERFVDIRLPEGQRIYNRIKNSNEAVVGAFKNEVGATILENIQKDDSLTYDQKVKKAGDLVYSRELNQINAAKNKRSAIDALGNVIPAFKLGGIFRDEKEETKNLNSVNATIETNLNKVIKEGIIYEQAKLTDLVQEAADKAKTGELSDEEKVNYKTRIDQLQSNIDAKQKDYKSPQKLRDQYPILLKQSLISDINEFNAIKSGNVKGYEDAGYEGISLEEHLRAKGYDLKDQVVQDTVLDAVQGVGVKDYSFFGEPVKAIKEVFKSSIKSLGDITGLRDDVTILSEKTAAEMFPTTVGSQDELQLTETAKVSQNIGNTTGQIIGQGLMQVGTAGIGRMAGLSKVAAANIGFWSSGALTSYDNAYKDSFDFIDSDTGRTAYAGLIALANAASEKIFPEAKIFNIPGVKNSISELASKVGTKEFTEKLGTELLTKAKNAFIDYGEKYAKNVSKETLEETATSLFESGARYVFGDPNIDFDQAIETAKNTAIQTAIGTSLIGGFGAHKDVQQEKNISAKSVIYNAAVYHDEAMDALNIGFEQGLYNEQELNSKISLLNTAQVGLGELQKAEQVVGRELTRPQKELFVANTTAQKLLIEQKKGVEDSAVLQRIDEKLNNLNSQQTQLLDNKVQIDDLGNVVVPKAEVVVEETATETPLDIVNSLKENANIPAFELTAMIADPQAALQTIADQALGFGRDEQGNRQPLTEGVNEPQLEATERKFGKEVVDKAIALFPAEDISSPIITQNVQESNSPVIGQQEIGGQQVGKNVTPESGSLQSQNAQERQPEEVANNTASANVGAVSTALKDVESTTIALEELQKNDGDRFADIENKYGDYFDEDFDPEDRVTPFRQIAEAYHDAKKDGGNIELVKAVEQSLSTNKEAIKDQPIAEEKIFTTNALKRAEAKKIYSEVRQLDEPSDAKGLALAYLANGGKIGEDAINEVAGTVKRASLNTGAKETKSSEVKARDYATKSAKSIDEIVHEIWDNLPEDLQGKIDIQDIKNELQDAINSHNTRLSSAQEYINSYGVEEPTFATEEQVTEEEQRINQWLNSESDIDYEPEFISDNETLNIINNEIENETENQQPATNTESSSSETNSTNSSTKESEAEATEVVKNIGQKARDLAKQVREKGVLPNWMKADLPEGTKLNGIDINEAFARALETFADVYDKVKDFTQAVEEGFKHIRDWYNDNGVAFDEADLKQKFSDGLNVTEPTVKELAEQIRKDEITYNDAIEGKSEKFIDELNTELFGSKKFNFDSDRFKEQTRKQKSFGLTEAEVTEGFEAAKKLTKAQKALIAEIYAETADTDKIAAELKESFKALAQGQKPKSVLKRLSVSNVTQLVKALSDTLTYTAVSNKQLNEMADFIVESIDLNQADQYINAMVNNAVADVKQVLRAKLIVALQKEGNTDLATSMIRDMADEATMAGRQTQSLTLAYNILNAQGNAATRTEFARRYAEAVQEKAKKMTQRMGDVISEQEAEIGKLNEKLHRKTQSSSLITQIKNVISNLCGLRGKK